MTMRSIVLLSVGVHVAALLFGQLGLDQLFIEREVAAQIIPVEIVRVSSKTVAPPPDEPESLPEPPTPPAPPEQQVAAANPPPPPEPLPPEPTVAPEPAAPPEPDIVAAPPEPAPQPEPPAVVKARPKAKPQPPVRRQFVNVLKDFAVIEQPPLPQLPVSQTLEPRPSDRAPVTPATSRVATVAEVDALAAIVRRQIEPCWNPPIGAVEAEDLIVRLLVRVDRAGYVREAQILGAGRLALNPFFEAAADSARRAVLNDRCRPLSLPLDRYELWKELELTFNPSDMLG